MRDNGLSDCRKIRVGKGRSNPVTNPYMVADSHQEEPRGCPGCDLGKYIGSIIYEREREKGGGKGFRGCFGYENGVIFKREGRYSHEKKE